MKRFLLIGFIVVLLAAIPLTIYILVTQKTVTKSGAAPSSKLAFVAPTDPVVVGTPVTLPITVDPTANGGSNIVSFVKIAFTYDGNKLQVFNAPGTSSYFKNDTAFPTTLEGPTNTCDSNKLCTISVTVSIGANPQQGVSSLTNVGTVSFTPLAATDSNNPTVLNFVANQIQILSLATADQPAENVFAGGTSLPLTIVTAGSLSGTPIPSDTPTPTPPSTTTDNNNNNTGTENNTGTTATGSTNNPTCTSLTADQNNTDSGAPFTVLLTAVGSSNASTISQVAFNFGDGNTQNITTGGGIGTANVSTQISHVYQANGTFTATATLTDADGNTSAAGSCSQTIAIGGTGTQSAQTNDTPTPTGTPKPVTTVGATGPGQTFLIAGAGGAILTTIGIVLLLAL